MFLFLEQGQPLLDLVQNVTHGKRAVACAKAPAVAIDKNGRYPIGAEVDRHIFEGIVQSEVALNAECRTCVFFREAKASVVVPKEYRSTTTELVVQAIQALDVQRLVDLVGAAEAKPTAPRTIPITRISLYSVAIVVDDVL